MARVLENVGKDLLKENGVPTPEFIVAATSEEARRAAQKIGCPVVIKALVTAGKRGKAGAACW
jgi:succinyl-CoA synthetase beta subunit